MPDYEPFIRQLMQDYGYHAVPLALLWDPGGVPWPWIILMLLATEGGKSIPLMLLYGLGVLMAVDHLTYWIGALGERALIGWVQPRWPKLAEAFDNARNEIVKRGAVAVIFGRYLMFIGRWVGLGAGLAGVPYGRFTLYSAIGCASSAWGFGIVASLVGREAIKSPYFYPALGILFIGGMLSGIVFTIIVAWRARRKQKLQAIEEARSTETIPAIEKAETL